MDGHAVIGPCHLGKKDQFTDNGTVVPRFLPRMAVMVWMKDMYGWCWFVDGAVKIEVM